MAEEPVLSQVDSDSPVVQDMGEDPQRVEPGALLKPDDSLHLLLVDCCTACC